MRKICLFCLAVCLILSGCGLQAAGQALPTETTTPPADNFLRNITLDMTPEQLLAHLALEKLAIAMPDYGEYPLPESEPDAVADGRIYNMSDYSFYYQLQDYALFFTFSCEGLLICVSCRDPRIQTPAGLSAGDSLDRVTTIYGDADPVNPEGLPVLQYRNAQGYLNIFYEENQVISWSYNGYSNIYND